MNRVEHKGVSRMRWDIQSIYTYILIPIYLHLIYMTFMGKSTIYSITDLVHEDSHSSEPRQAKISLDGGYVMILFKLFCGQFIFSTSIYFFWYAVLLEVLNISSWELLCIYEGGGEEKGVYSNEILFLSRGFHF